jgi:hypothetical protein
MTAGNKDFKETYANTFILAKRAYALRVSGKCGDFVAVTMHALKGPEVLFVAFHFDSYMAAPR